MADSSTEAISVVATTAAAAVAAAADALSAATQEAPQAVTAGAQAVSDAVTAATQAVQTGTALWLDRLYYLIMVPLVYLSILALMVGVIWRCVVIFRSPAHSYNLKLYPAARRPGLAALGESFAMPQVRRHKPVFWLFLILYHAAFLLLFLGHLDILPRLNIMPASSKHMLGWGGVGVAVTLSLLVFIVRRFRSPVREISVPADFLLLLLLLFLFLLGDTISWANSWAPNGFVMGKQDFAAYFGGLARFTFANPRDVLHGSHYHFVVLHVLLADLFFIVLPFTKIMHTFFAVPINLLRRK